VRIVVALRNLTLDELRAEMELLGEPGYRAEQVFRWVHGRGVDSLEAMTDVSKPLRARLAGKVDLARLAVADVQESADGTQKLALRTAEGALIESVLIPEGEKLTQCISSQVGCALDCDFCATAKMGFGRHLSAGEIVDQVYHGRERAQAKGRRITNLVFMGMGEPLHNYTNVVKALALLQSPLGLGLSHRRITVSTAGMVPAIEKLGRDPVECNLAISLSATTDDVRDRIMPVNRKWNIAALIGAIRAYPLARRQRVTFEYVLLDGVNDTAADAERLPRLLAGIPCKVNLIPFNPHPLAPYRRPPAARIDEFQEALKARGLAVYLRRPRGDDIDAACGQLACRGDTDRQENRPIVPLRIRRAEAAQS
jgi:23S rRNA (adenine2503-C2)-methyltransferase